MSDEPNMLKMLADSRLEHVLIALRDGDRAYNVRDVLDPWWCFERGGDFVVNRQDGGYGDVQFNKPCPWAKRHILPQFDDYSTGVVSIMDLGETARISNRRDHLREHSIVVDHAVPFRVLREHLWREPRSWDKEKLTILLQNNFKRVVISYEEDARLDEHGLNAQMPTRWQIGDDPFARYKAVNIKLVKSD